MKNYIKIDGKKVEISDETANNFRKMLNLKPKPRAKTSSRYYYITANAEVTWTSDFKGDSFNDKLHMLGNYFLKEKDAKAAVKKLKEFWKSLI